MCEHQSGRHSRRTCQDAVNKLSIFCSPDGTLRTGRSVLRVARRRDPRGGAGPAAHAHTAGSPGVGLPVARDVHAGSAHEAWTGRLRAIGTPSTTTSNTTGCGRRTFTTTGRCSRGSKRCRITCSSVKRSRRSWPPAPVTSNGPQPSRRACRSSPRKSGPRTDGWWYTRPSTPLPRTIARPAPCTPWRPRPRMPRAAPRVPAALRPATRQTLRARREAAVN